MTALTSRSFSCARWVVLAAIWLVLLTSSLFGQSRLTRVAVLDLGSDQTSSRQASLRGAAAIRELFHSQNGNNMETAKEFEVVDPDQSRAAAVGAGYKGSLNLDLQQARDLGAAIGCDFYFLSNTQTVE